MVRICVIFLLGGVAFGDASHRDPTVEMLVDGNMERSTAVSRLSLSLFFALYVYTRGGWCTLLLRAPPGARTRDHGLMA